MRKDVVLAAVAVCLMKFGAVAAEVPPIPNLSDWEKNMKNNAKIVAQQPVPR